MSYHIYQYGLGDILFLALMQREKIINTINFNVIYFYDDRYYQYYDEELKLRVKLIEDLGMSVDYMESHNVKLRESHSHLIKKINNFKLCFPLERPISVTNYIVFHTKFRPAWEIKHRIDIIRNMFRSFCATFKSKYKIVLLGERNLKQDMEVNILSITTIYDELLLLRSNNEVLDLTEDLIMPNYDKLRDNIDIIRNANYNVCIGHGGAFCLSIAYSKLCYAYIDGIDYSHLFNIDRLRENNVYLYSDFDLFTKQIEEYVL